MGKRSKNPRKKGKPPTDSNPYVRELEKKLLKAPRREWSPSTTRTQDAETESEKYKDDIELQGFRRELKEFEGKWLSCEDESDAEVKARLKTIAQWSFQPKYHRMRQLILITAMNYLVDYEFSGDVLELVRGLVGVFSAIDEIYKCRLENTEASRKAIDELCTYIDKEDLFTGYNSINKGFAKASGHCESQLSITRYIYRKLVQNNVPRSSLLMLKALKRKLKGEPEITECSNGLCCKSGDIDDFLYCSKCRGKVRYCCKECQKVDWDKWHKTVCREYCRKSGEFWFI